MVGYPHFGLEVRVSDPRQWKMKAQLMLFHIIPFSASQRERDRRRDVDSDRQTVNYDE